MLSELQFEQKNEFLRIVVEHDLVLLYKRRWWDLNI